MILGAPLLLLVVIGFVGIDNPAVKLYNLCLSTQQMISMPKGGLVIERTRNSSSART